jgi:hypothetical protein
MLLGLYLEGSAQDTSGKPSSEHTIPELSIKAIVVLNNNRMICSLTRIGIENRVLHRLATVQRDVSKMNVA